MQRRSTTRRPCRTVLERTGAKSAKAVIHCQGSTSFMMAAVAGLLPEITTVVSNAVALHPVVPRLAYLKSRFLTNSVGRFLPYLNPQWGLSAPRGWPTLIDWFVRATHHECNNPVCKHSSFTFGAGFPTLWLHENLDDDIHEWLKGEFAHVPMSFFREMHDCIAKGVLVSSGKYPELPGSSTLRRRKPRRASSSSAASTISALRRRASSAPSTSSTGMRPGGTPSTRSPVTATSTCSSARTPRATTFR